MPLSEHILSLLKPFFIEYNTNILKEEKKHMKKPGYEFLNYSTVVLNDLNIIICGTNFDIFHFGLSKTSNFLNFLEINGVDFLVELIGMILGTSLYAIWFSL